MNVVLFSYFGLSLLFLSANTLTLQSIGCPKNCSCSKGINKEILTHEQPETVATLTIDCRNRTNIYNSTTDTLAGEINDMLAGLDGLSFLKITNSLLQTVPAEICNKVIEYKLH